MNIEHENGLKLIRASWCNVIINIYIYVGKILNKIKMIRIQRAAYEFNPFPTWIIKNNNNL